MAVSWLVLLLTSAAIAENFILSTLGNGDSIFNNYDYVKQSGYTHIGAANLMMCVSYSWLSPDVYPKGSSAEAWREKCVVDANNSIAAAHAAGLKTNHGMDVFIFPATLVELYPNMTDGTPKRIALTPMTKLVIAGMIDEAMSLFPTANSFMIRVGENYLPSQPGFVGNEAVDFSASFPVQQAQYVDLITTMKGGFVDKHNRTFVVRTWDTSGFGPGRPKRFHSSLDYYLNVTNQIQPNPKLIFSIKHVMLDFWRYVAFNPSLTQGKHQQIIEVECAREYEGKGAMPNYIGHGVINSWSEVMDGKGLTDVVRDPLTTGLWLWSSGGGWGGPTVGHHEVWPQLNTLVILRWWLNNSQPAIGALAHSNLLNTVSAANYLTADAAFLATCELDFGMSSTRCPLFLAAAVRSQDAILQTRYCEAYDTTLGNQYMPTNNWMRDDRLGGFEQLEKLPYGTWPVFQSLYGNNTLQVAVDEKYTAIATWSAVKQDLAAATQGNTSTWATYVNNSAQYGYLLAKLIAAGWKTMALGFTGDQTGSYDQSALAAAIQEYDAARGAYNTFVRNGTVATPFFPYYEDIDSHGGGHVTHSPGLNATVDVYRAMTL